MLSQLKLDYKKSSKVEVKIHPKQKKNTKQTHTKNRLQIIELMDLEKHANVPTDNTHACRHGEKLDIREKKQKVTKII